MRGQSGHYINIQHFIFSWHYSRIVWQQYNNNNNKINIALITIALTTINVSLKVSKSENKGQYEWYETREMTKFTMVNDIFFYMGFFNVGRVKCDI